MTTQTAAPKSFGQIVDEAILGARVEPEKRMVAGFYRNAIHRFQIKGGITLLDLMAETLAETNSLLRAVKSRPE